MTVLEISLTDLLNDKWEIISGAPATGFVLRKGAKWVECDADSGQMFGGPPSSQCRALN
jgi:hypothetical protein